MIKKLNCPVCGKPMVMKDCGDSIKKLECKDCEVTKNFSSWAENTNNDN